MKLSKIALATAAFAAIASGSAFAGQIGSSSVTLASEVIVTDTQIVRAPTNVYGFAGNIDATTNQQLLQLQYSLTAGTWSNAVFANVNTLVPLTVGGAGATVTDMLRISYQDAANTAQNSFPVGSTVSAFVTANRRTLVFNVTIPAANAPANLIRTPSFTINSSAIGAGANSNAGISALFSLVQPTACFATDKNIDINFKHATTHNSNTDLITNFPVDSEHLRTGSANDARFTNFVQNQIFTFLPAATTSRTDANFMNQRLAAPANFTPTAGTAAAGGNPGTNSFANAFTAGPAAAPVTRHYLGRINLTQRANGTDLDFATIYGKTTANPALQAATDFSVVATAAVVNGPLEIGRTNVTINFPTPLPVGTVVRATDGSGADVIAPITITAANASSITFTDATAGVITQAAKLNGSTAGAPTPAGGLNIFADFPGNAVINGVSGITVNAVLLKAASAGPTNPLNEQPLTCNGGLTGIGGGIRIDIRNYASRAKYPTGNYVSIVRLINNSESQVADITAQMIYADGSYGPYGVLPALAPRAVANYTNAQLEALLNTTPPVGNPFGASTVYTQIQGGSVVGTGSPQAVGIGDRIRFVSNNGTTLRVQSYLALPGGSVIDTSGAQGVDFENGSNNRTPANALDAQPNSQDAINGLAR